MESSVRYLFKKSRSIIPFIILTAFFFIGLEISISPLRESLNTVNEQTAVLKKTFTHAPPIKLNYSYISEKQLKIDILHYDIDIDLYPADKKILGDVTLTGRFVDQKISEIDLNFYNNLKISSVQFNGNESEFENKGTRLTIKPSNELTDTFTIRVIYEGTPKRAGLSAFVFGEINDKSVVYNMNEPDYASTWFPCNDLPSDKALMDIKITNSASQTSVSNGILKSVEQKGDRKTYHWFTVYPISTYLIAIYSAEYEKFSHQYVSLDNKDTMNIDYFVFPDHIENAKKDFDEHIDMMNYFAKTFGEYPFIKEKYGVAEFLWQFGAMEHQTITGVGSNFVTGNKYITDVYVHELAHHWWGNAVGPATWKDIWLNEGFATYSEALYAEYNAGKEALQSVMVSKFDEDFEGRLYDPGEDLFSNTVYEKGAWVLHMLRREVGDTIFFKILRTYFETYKYSNASTDNFINLCEKLSGKDLKKFFDQWVYTGEDIINLNYTWKVVNDGDKFKTIIELTQTQEKYDTYNFNIDILLIDGSSSYIDNYFVDSKNQKIEIISDVNPKDVALDPYNWLLANIFNKNTSK